MSGRSDDTATACSFAVKLVVFGIKVSNTTSKRTENARGCSGTGRDSVLESFAALSGDAQGTCVTSLCHLPCVFILATEMKEERLSFKAVQRKPTGILSASSSCTLALCPRH